MSESPDSLFRRLAAQADDALPPVHLWHPAETRDIGMRVTRDGTWWYQGSPVNRTRMVRMFARILRREPDGYFLVTPAEKVRLEVEVAPLLAIRMEVRDAAGVPEIAFETSTGDIVVADREHPVRMLGTPDEPLPVVEVRDGIEALIARSVYYELVEQAELTAEGDLEILSIRSRGDRFRLGVV